MNKILITSIVLLTLAACNTVSGVGKDIKSIGTTVDKTSVNTSKSIDKFHN